MKVLYLALPMFSAICVLSQTACPSPTHFKHESKGGKASTQQLPGISGAKHCCPGTHAAGRFG